MKPKNKCKNCGGKALFSAFCCPACRKEYNVYKGIKAKFCDICHEPKYTLYTFAENKEKMCSVCIGRILYKNHSALEWVKMA